MPPIDVRSNVAELRHGNYWCYLSRCNERDPDLGDDSPARDAMQQMSGLRAAVLGHQWANHGGSVVGLSRTSKPPESVEKCLRVSSWRFVEGQIPLILFQLDIVGSSGSLCPLGPDDIGGLEMHAGFDQLH